MAVNLSDLLQQNGFGQIKAELWSQFVGHVFAVFRAAAKELRHPSNWDAFKRKRGALGVRRARRRRKTIERIPVEDALTSELAHFIRHIRRSLPTGHFLRLNEVEFHVEDLVQSDSRAGRYSRKIDFRVFASSGLEGPEIAIEAKPLLNKADISGRYLAEEGIGCFFTPDSPYALQGLGAMLAYTINKDGRSWRSELQAAIQAYTPAASQIADVIVTGEPGPIICSCHERAKLRLDPLGILHFEILFEPDLQDDKASISD